jgi:hypothetical protein
LRGAARTAMSEALYDFVHEIGLLIGGNVAGADRS